MTPYPLGRAPGVRIKPNQTISPRLQRVFFKELYIFVLSKEGWGNKCLRSNVTAYIDDLDGRNELLFSSSFFTNV